MWKAKYIVKSVMKASSRPVHWHTFTPSTFTTLNPLPVIAIFQLLSISWMVGWGVVGSPYIKEKHAKRSDYN